MKKALVVLLLVKTSLFSYSQQLDKRIHQLFSEWEEEGHPGGVLEIRKKGECFYSESFGHANIKYNIPIDSATLFNMGSVSKQFTAIGIVKLYLENKLAFDDDIRKYLPELHEFDQIITIRHLLHHTSGIRSTPELFGLAGWRDGDAITTEDDYRFLCKQTGLNFTTGEQFMYSNSNYVLLALIIERITASPFHVWMKEHVFSPLQMNNTFIDAMNSNHHANCATPYLQMGEKHFVEAENTSLDIGASNGYTTASDLSRWMDNFRKPTSGWERAFELLQTTDSLNDGGRNDYAFGVLVDDFYGNQRIQHSGGIPGFLSYTEYYPEDELSIVLLTNFTSFSVQQKKTELLQLFLKNKSPKRAKRNKLKTKPLIMDDIPLIVGDYWCASNNFPRMISYENDTLWYVRDNGRKSPLYQVNDFEFVMGGVKDQVTVKFYLEEKKKMIVDDSRGIALMFEVYDNSTLSSEELALYTGGFYSRELETRYEVKVQNGQLVGYHSRHGEFPIQMLKRDVVDWSGFAIARYARNEQGEILGFYVDVNRVENVWFEKVADTSFIGESDQN